MNFGTRTTACLRDVIMRLPLATISTAAGGFASAGDGENRFSISYQIWERDLQASRWIGKIRTGITRHPTVGGLIPKRRF